MLLLTMAGCERPSAIDGIECSVDTGAWHDVYLINKSGKDLHEVKMSLTLIGEKGEPRSEDRYYVLWANGQIVKTSLSMENSPLNVQRISLTGSCTEGRIDSSWPNPPKGILKAAPPRLIGSRSPAGDIPVPATP
jgi:hypothetical protein